MSMLEATTVYRYDSVLQCWYCIKCEICSRKPQTGEPCHKCGRIITWIEPKEKQ